MNLHRVTARLRGASDLVLAALALATVSLLVAPLPTWLLDLALAANLAFSAMVLVVALFARDALRFASFPTLLLFTTLYRLALEVSSTRLVLARGDAGRVIQAFGRVAVAGNYVVGAVVFAILTLVQLLVIAKGAERVAEVAARFTLDALPGKQMSIDADLRAGAIDQAEARRRRRALEREGQLYGAMDGALKFVKGDAVAGVVIVLVNVAGGLVAGLARGLPLEAAARRYALLAIGDGLAAQIPALLVSVAAAVAVTRVGAEEEGGSLSGELGRQLFGDARALAAVAALCLALGLVPGVPLLPFLALAAAATAAAVVARARRAPPPEAAGGARAVAAGDDAAASPLVVELGPDLAASAIAARLGGELLPAVRAGLADELGVPLPAVAVRAAPLAPGAWRLLLDDVPAAAGHAPPHEALALASPDELAAVGILARPEPDPLGGGCAARIAAADAARARALAPVRDAAERIASAVAAALRAHAHHLLGVQDVSALLEVLERTQPVLVREVAQKLPATVLADVLRQLLEEGISLRPLRTILEAALDASTTARSSAALVERCRRALARHLAHAHATGGALEALLLDPTAEATLRAALVDGVLAISPQAAETLRAAVAAALAGSASAAVVLAPAEVRRPLRQLLAPRHPHVTVLAYDELPPALQVRPLGALSPDLGPALPGATA